MTRALAWRPEASSSERPVGSAGISGVSLLAACDRVFGIGDPQEDARLVPGVSAPLATGREHTCHIRSDSTLWCWGANTSGQLGVSSQEPEIEIPSRVAGTSWRAVAAKNQHTCAIDTGGTLWCWGDNASGQQGVLATPSETAPVQVDGTWKEVVTGMRHTCAIDADDGLYCWARTTQVSSATRR
jgi:hypothetical protein